jgi:hypothetical protein
MHYEVKSLSELAEFFRKLAETEREKMELCSTMIDKKLYRTAADTWLRAAEYCMLTRIVPDAKT